MKYNFLLLAHEYLPVFEKPETISILGGEEKDVNYGIVATVVENPPLKKKLDRFETTTVWILSEENFEGRLNKNVINRYSTGDGILTITFDSGNEIKPFSFNEEKGLLFIKSPFLNNRASRANIEIYLQKLCEFIKHLKKGGYLVIQTKDVRINGYIEPMVKRVIDVLESVKSLWLKEIIIVVPEGLNFRTHNAGEYLNIKHQYLIVYEKIDEN